MSARTESLLEEIKKTEEALVEARAQGLKPTAIMTIEANLSSLRSKLTSATQALTEGKTLLKD